MTREETRLRAIWLSHWEGHVSRIEPAVGSSFGFPDTLLAAKQDMGLVEFKAADKSTAIEFRPAQRAWARSFLPHCPKAAVVALDDEGFWCFSYSHVPDLVGANGRLTVLLVPAVKKVKWKQASFPVLLDVTRKAWHEAA